LVRVVNDKIESLTPFGIISRSWLETFLDLQTKDGEFWIPTDQGFFRYPKIADFSLLAKTSPKYVYTTKDGLYVDSTAVAFEDSRGDIWFSTPTDENSVLRWEKATDKIHQYKNEPSFPKSSGAVAFGEDKFGNVWISFYFGQLVRFKNGKFRSLSDEGIFPQTSVSQMLTDKNGHFWLATRSRGLFKTENPNDETPIFNNFSTAQGFSSNQALCLTQDKSGRIYIGTGRGINRYEIETSRIKVFTQNDGLPSNIVSQCYADATGNLWFAVNNSLIKFNPTAENKTSPPPIFIDSISINGRPQKISEMGETEVKNLEFAPDEKQIQIGFFAISFDSGESLRYQYKLNKQDWSEPSNQRIVDLNLSAGNYDFEVRAVNSDGVFSEKSAAFSFKILPPIYQRWWFVTLVALLIASLIFALDRYRVSKTRQVEAALDETRRAGKIIRESEIRYRTLAETASDAIITIDKNSNIVYVNEACEQIFGFTAKELMGKPLVSLMPERHRSHHDAGIKRYLESKTKSFEWNAVELQGLHKLGHEIPLELSFGEFEKDGERFFTGIARDISERKKAEAALQKAREERIAELQRVRSRIATDLHDDIGSSLTQITLFSEIARQRERDSGKVGEPLDTISNVANELVETMSDIVWAINPKKDHLQDLTQRMRRFAANVFTAKDIEMTFRAPDSETEIPLGANIRREVFLIFKETVNNIVKHSEATEAEIVFTTEDRFLNISFRDNGKGFDQNEKISENGNHDWKKFRGGNGLNNMKRRAEDLGGNYEIHSKEGKGTTVILKIPLEISELAVKKQ
ncbi:MAG TPA: PAS domain S-box protein, partial [Pyrinomonadaceae bacterium]|nr:PAS domain S-box protein [Pyrinomonadaceae bacterium]